MLPLPTLPSASPLRDSAGAAVLLADSVMAPLPAASPEAAEPANGAIAAGAGAGAGAATTTPTPSESPDASAGAGGASEDRSRPGSAVEGLTSQVRPEDVIVLTPLADTTQAGIDSALKRTRKRKSNKRCAECGTKRPGWASVNLGILVCLRCSGLHRQLGTHLSQVCTACHGALGDCLLTHAARCFCLVWIALGSLVYTGHVATTVGVTSVSYWQCHLQCLLGGAAAKE